MHRFAFIAVKGLVSLIPVSENSTKDETAGTPFLIWTLKRRERRVKRSL